MRFKKSTILSFLAFVVIFIVIPLGILNYQAKQKGLTLGQFIKRVIDRMGDEPSKPEPSRIEKTKSKVKIIVTEVDKIKDDPTTGKPAPLVISEINQDTCSLT